MARTGQTGTTRTAVAIVLAAMALLGAVASCGRLPGTDGRATADRPTANDRPANDRPANDDRPGSTTAAGDVAVVTKVVDGDTVRVRFAEREGDERVRLIGVDTPETRGPGGLRECFGREAAARMAALLPPGTQVRLERDAELRDRYGRLLAYVYRASDDLFVNLTLAREGFAAALTVPPNVAHEQDFVAAAAAARAADRGLWGRCGSPDVAVDSPP